MTSRRILIGVLCVTVATLLLSGSASALNFFGPEDLDESVTTPLGPALPVIADGGLLISVTPSINGISYSMQVSEHQVTIIRDYIDVFVDDMAYIPFGESDGEGLMVPASPTEYDGVVELDIELSGKSKGQLLIVPLINFPEGTEGYVVPLMVHDGDYVVPLIYTPRGHYQSQNKHSVNPWGFEYDLGMALDYI